MRKELEQQAQRLHLLIHQLQSSVIVAAEADGDDYETIVKTASGVLWEGLENIDMAGGDSAMILMMVLLTEGVRV
jgi:hypothetical protein